MSIDTANSEIVIARSAVVVGRLEIKDVDILSLSSRVQVCRFDRLVNPVR